jgi:hypothetical protein
MQILSKSISSRRQKTEDRRQETEDRRQKTEVRSQKTEDGGLEARGRIWSKMLYF